MKGVDQVFQEKASGKSMRGRPELDKAIESLGTGDLFVIAEWDRATRSMMDGITILQRVADRGSLVKVLDKPWLDLTTPMGKGILAFLSALAEDEHNRITKRAAVGRQLAKDKGVRFGRKLKLTPHQQELARSRYIQGESMRSIAKDLGVSHNVVSRLVS